jgi:hypothetical protein
MDLLRAGTQEELGRLNRRKGFRRKRPPTRSWWGANFPRFSWLPPLAGVALYGPNDKVATKVARPKARGRGRRKTVSGGWG